MDGPDKVKPGMVKPWAYAVSNVTWSIHKWEELESENMDTRTLSK